MPWVWRSIVANLAEMRRHPGEVALRFGGYASAFAVLAWFSNEPRPDVPTSVISGIIAAALVVPVFWRTIWLPLLVLLALVALVLRWLRPFGLPNEALDAIVVITAIIILAVTFAYLRKRSPRKVGIARPAQRASDSSGDEARNA